VVNVDLPDAGERTNERDACDITSEITFQNLDCFPERRALIHMNRKS